MSGDPHSPFLVVAEIYKDSWTYYVELFGVLLRLISYNYCIFISVPDSVSHIYITSRRT